MPSDPLEEDQTPKSWLPLENRLYRRHVLYHQLSWNLDTSQLANAITAAAPNSGPLAVIPDAGWGLSFSLAVYTLSGRLISIFDRLRERTVPPFRAVAVGWAFNDSLSIVYNDGVVVRLRPDLHPSNISLIRAFPNAVNERIHDAVVLPCSHVIMRTASGKILSIDSRDSVRTDSIVVPPPEGIVRDVPNCGIVAVNRYNMNNIDNINNIASTSMVDTLLVTANGNITSTNSSKSFTHETDDDDVSQIATSANGLYVAALDANAATLSVSTIDLRTRIAHVNIAEKLSLLGIENVYSDVIFDPKAPESLAWVGSDSVAVLYKEHLVLVGPRGGVAVIPLDDACANCALILHTEIDGLTLVSPTNVQFIQMVPEAVSIVRTQKQSAGFKLFRSSSTQQQQQQKHSIQPLSSLSSIDSLTRYRLLRELRDSQHLLNGARHCVQAAFLELDILFQQRLLHAASYGIRHATVFDQGFVKAGEPSSDETSNDINSSINSSTINARKKKDDLSRMNDLTMMPAAIATLRILNVIRTASGGIPVTKPQFDSIGLSAIVARLSRYGEHTLALRLATFSGVSVYDILSEWASATIRTNAGDTDEALTVLISDRFETVRRSLLQSKSKSKTYARYEYSNVKSTKGIILPYVKAAEVAFSTGRPKCAELLLQREVRYEPKVNMYLKMNREAPAILTAVESGDPELVLDALGNIFEMKSVRDTARLIRTLPFSFAMRATDLLITHLRQLGDLGAVKIVLTETGRLREATLVDISLVHDIRDTTEYISSLDRLSLSISRSPGGYLRRLCPFELSAVQHARLVANCALEVEKRGRLESGTLRHASDGELLARAIVDIHDKTKRGDMIMKLKRELKVPDRRYFWVCLESMGEIGDFESIEALSYSLGSGRAPPIGLMAFVDTCIRYGTEEDAIKYAMRMPDLRDRARALARCGRGREAADIASRLRNQQLLAEVQELAARHVANLSKVPRERPKLVTPTQSQT